MLKSVLRSRFLISITTNTETHCPTVRPLTFLMSCERYFGVPIHAALLAKIAREELHEAIEDIKCAGVEVIASRSSAFEQLTEVEIETLQAGFDDLAGKAVIVVKHAGVQGAIVGDNERFFRFVERKHRLLHEREQIGPQLRHGHERLLHEREVLKDGLCGKIG